MSDVPHRVQLSRAKGWRKPANTVVVSRPSRWGNPYPAGDDSPFSRSDAVRMYREVLTRGETWWDGHRFRRSLTSLPAPADVGQLRGKNLACWCPLDQPCHADVLLDLANGPVAP